MMLIESVAGEEYLWRIRSEERFDLKVTTSWAYMNAGGDGI